VIFRTPRRSAPSRRGQALVEFALILPVLALLLVMTIDLGRVFFGWVAIHNAARIGADHAARHPDAWPPPGSNPIEEGALELYVDLIVNDLQAINCDPDIDGDGDVDLDDFPVAFQDVNGNAQDHDEGDHVIVTLGCQMQLLTPLAELVMGGPVDIGAEAIFAINKSATLALPTPIPTASPVGPPPDPTPPPPVCAAPNADFDADPTTGPKPLSVDFSDMSTTAVDCPILTWSWDFDGGNPNTSGQQNPTSVFTYNGNAPSKTFNVELTVTNSGGSDTHQVTITATRP
jgi:hypothetical protein